MIHRAWRWVMRFDLSDEDWALLGATAAEEPKERAR